MSASVITNLLGFGIIVIVISLLTWSLYHKAVSPLGLALLIFGFVLQIAAAFLN